MTSIRPEGSGEIRVLAVDGGGVRGLLPASLLAAIESDPEVTEPIHRLFNVLAGTSTGALIVAALARPHGPIDAESVRRFYDDEAFTIFPERRRLHRVRSRPQREADFDDALRTYLGDSRLADCTVEVLVPAYDELNGEVVLFTREAARTHSREARLADVVLASSAAPSYLPPIPMQWAGTSRRLVDGGVFANNPSLAVIATLRASFPRRPIRVLSLGCGIEHGSNGRESADRGRIKKWVLGDADDQTLAGTLLSVFGTFSDASSDMAAQASMNILGDAYLRIQPVFEPGARPELDHATSETIEAMTAVAERCWQDNRTRILEFLRP